MNMMTTSMMVKTKFNFQNTETKSSDEYNSRCDKQLIQLENIVSSEYFYFYLWDRLVLKNIYVTLLHVYCDDLDMTPIFLDLIFFFSISLSFCFSIFSMAFHSPFDNNCKRESNSYGFLYINATEI